MDTDTSEALIIITKQVLEHNQAIITITETIVALQNRVKFLEEMLGE